MEGTGRADPAAEVDLVDVALVGGETGRRQRRRERGFAVLCRTPYLTLVGRVERGGIHRLHASVVLVGVGVNRLDLLGRLGNSVLGVAVRVANEGLRRVEAGLEPLRDRGARDFGILAFVPDHWQRIERDRKSTRLNSSHSQISYAVFCLKKKNIAVCLFFRDRERLA